MAIYNEEKFLPYSLPPVADSFFDEVVVVLDRCTDNSERMVKGVMDTRFVLFNKSGQDWKYPCAESKNTGCTLANGELLMISDADVILDVDAVKRAIELFDEEDWNFF
jgi:glycosyltransferase involved in cell wall biosynthesis